MKNGKKIYYWDTAPILAWVTNETRDDPSEMDGVSETLHQVEAGNAVICTSVLWRAEVLNSTLSTDQKNLISLAFQGQRIQQIAVNFRIMELAMEIRDYHKRNPAKDVIHNISTPDAIHLASAIYSEVDEFHTFDGKKKSGAKAKLLTLDGNVAGHRLRVCTPRPNPQQHFSLAP